MVGRVLYSVRWSLRLRLLRELVVEASRLVSDR
jgi:hypothetical protein